jgi:hypothetical protein
MSLFAKLIGTNLKSLKWGHLRTPGDSTVPYITTNINNVNSYVRDRYSNGLKEDDLTIRGSKTGAKYASTVDSVRINKFLKDPLKGSFFLYNQVKLQQSNPLIGQSIYIKPPDLESKEIAESIRHYSNGGTSTLAQISKTAYGEHIPRHGDIFSYTPGKYEDIMELQKKGDKSYEKNKLYNYYLNLFNIRSIFNNTIRYDNGQSIIDRYDGGPNSAYGLGETKIRRFVYSGNPDKIDNSLRISYNKINNFSDEYQIYKDYSLSAKDDINTVNSRIKPKHPLDPDPYNKLKMMDYKTEYDVEGETNPNSYTGFKQPPVYKDYIQEGKGPITLTVKDQSKLDNEKLVRGKAAENYNYKIKDFISSYVKDESSMAGKGVYGRDDSRILNVEFTQINPFSGNKHTSQLFSGYINGYSENYSSNWNDIKYNGRAEFLYNFVSYKKTVSFNLQIPIFRVEDLIPTHDKLKELQSGLAGKYSSDSRLGGIITRIKLGHYLRNQYCIINSLNIKIPDEASWDWGIFENPFYISAYSTLLEASFTVTVIDDKIPTG